MNQTLPSDVSGWLTGLWNVVWAFEASRVDVEFGGMCLEDACNTDVVVVACGITTAKEGSEQFQQGNTDWKLRLN